jgi:hypothetical protein
MWKIKSANVRKFCEIHPEVDREHLLSVMSRDSIESLRKHNPLRYYKEHDLLDKTRSKPFNVKKIHCSNCGHEN